MRKRAWELSSELEEKAKFDDCLEVREALLHSLKELHGGNDHPDVAATLGNMAIVYKDQGNFDKALEMHNQELEIERKFKGNDHPDVAKTLNNIAMIYDDQGKYDEALANYEESLRVKRKVHGGNDHPDVAQSIWGIALVKQNQGKFDESLQDFEHV